MIEAMISPLEASGRSIAAAYEGLDEESARWRPGPARWSLLEILCHLLDEEREDFRRRIALLLEDRCPRGTGVVGKPCAAGGRADDDPGEIGFHRFDVGNAAGHVGRSDIPPTQVLGYGALILGVYATSREAGQEREQGSQTGSTHGVPPAETSFLESDQRQHGGPPG